MTIIDRPDHATDIDIGRARLQDWEYAQPDNFFETDPHLQQLLAYHWGIDAYNRHAPRLAEFGHRTATVIDRAARRSNLNQNLPRLERYSTLGYRTEDVEFHPDYHLAGEHIYGSGVMSVLGEPGNNLLSAALFYLSSYNGEAGHNCPLACTAGAIKALQALGTPELQQRFLLPLLDSDYATRYHAAQFLTEVQGGSDVGANATIATLINPELGTWLLNGEKWFCSNITADLSLVTARILGQGEGTGGLGLFLVPRYLDDGRPNGLYIRRLKDKLGTRSMASAEVDFRNALAYQLGTVEDGFKHIMRYVITFSRIYNALGTSGIARRAYLTAWTYAQHRAAFGYEIARYPLVQDLLATMRSDAVAMLVGTLQLVALVDRADHEGLDEGEQGFHRMATNLNKYRSSILTHQVVMQGIEVLGGNGAIETFSVLPRLLRDNVVFEQWEGTHNVLLAQVQRDIRRYALHKPFFGTIEGQLKGLADTPHRQAALAALADIRAELDDLLAMDDLQASVFFRPLMDRATDLYYAAGMLVVGEWTAQQYKDESMSGAATFFFSRRVLRRDAREIPGYAAQIRELSGAL